MPEGKDYCERKINLLKSNFDQLVEVINFVIKYSYLILIYVFIQNVVILLWRVIIQITFVLV